MSLISQIEGIFASNVNEPSFIIYTNSVIDPASDSVSSLDAVAIRFNTLKDLAYKKQVNVAYEPVELGSFSSDSKQQTPKSIFLTGIVAPIPTSATYSNQDYRDALSVVEQQLDNYVDSIELLTIIQSAPLFAQYTNMALTSVSYDITPDHQNLIAYLTLQEVRMVTSTQYGSLQQNQVSNPSNTSTVTTGNQQPITPAAGTFNTLGNPANG